MKEMEVKISLQGKIIKKLCRENNEKISEISYLQQSNYHMQREIEWLRRQLVEDNLSYGRPGYAKLLF